MRRKANRLKPTKEELTIQKKKGENMQSTSEIFYTALEKNLPPVFSREEAAKALGGLLQARTLRNIDMKGTGPKTKVRVGKKVGYERNTFVQWLKQYRPL
jgi:hypothetical protein